MLDSEQAIARALSISSWPAVGRCLEFVDWCFGNPTSRMGDLGPRPGGAPNGNWQDAKQGWYGSAFQHPGDGTDAPRGAPVYWETGPSGNTAGHIVISLGEGMCVTTDYAGPRSVSTQSIAYLNRLRGRALGWTEDYGNNPIDATQTIKRLEDELTPEQDHMLRNVYAAIFAGGESMPGGRSIVKILEPGSITRSATRPSVSEQGNNNLFQEVADAKTLGLDNRDAIKALGTKIDELVTKLGK